MGEGGERESATLKQVVHGNRGVVRSEEAEEKEEGREEVKEGARTERHI